ncbi:hypothetical protein Tco_0933526 [Tanacetum coccineum]
MRVMITTRKIDDNTTSFPSSNHNHVDYPESGEYNIDVVEDIPVDVLTIFSHPSHPSYGFRLVIPSHKDSGSDLDVSSPFGDRNKIYDPGICI